MTAACIEALSELRREVEANICQDVDAIEKIAALDEAIRLVEATDAISAAMGEDGRVPNDGRWYVLSSRVCIVDGKFTIDCTCGFAAEEVA